MSPFILKSDEWYAMLLLGDEFDASAMCTQSPLMKFVHHVYLDVGAIE